LTLRTQDTRSCLKAIKHRVTPFCVRCLLLDLADILLHLQPYKDETRDMLRDMLSGENNTNKIDKEEASRKDTAAENNPPDQRLDGEEYNVINHEDVEADVDVHHGHHDHQEEENEDEEQSFYRPGLAGLLGGRMMQRSNRNPPGKFDSLHPFTQVLSVSNVDDCVELEAETFPENERCSREKVWD
jgi:hypothetical protein